MFGAETEGAERRFRRWILIDGNRWVVAGGLALALFGSLVAVASVGTPPIRIAMTRKAPVETVYMALVTGIITGVTLVVTIDQLVLSKQLGALGEQRAELADALEFRTEVEELFGATSPAEPAALMTALVDTSHRRAEALVDAAEQEDGTLAEQVVRVATNHAEDARGVEAQLMESEFLRFGVLRAALEYDYTWRLHEALTLRSEAGDELGPEAVEALNDLIAALRLFGAGREYIRSLYFQSELVKLSRVILSVAVPALAVTLAALLFLDNGDYPGTTLGVSNLVWVVCATVTAATLPFLILVSYVLRIVSITQQTLTTGPFILHKTEYRGMDEE